MMALFQRNVMPRHCNRCFALMSQTTSWDATPPQTPHDCAVLPPLHDPTSTTAWFEAHGHHTTITRLPMPKQAMTAHGLADFQPVHCRGVAIEVQGSAASMLCFSWLAADLHTAISKAFMGLNNQPLGHLLFQETWQRQRFAYLRATHQSLMGRRSDFIHTSGARLHLVEFFCVGAHQLATWT